MYVYDRMRMCVCVMELMMGSERQREANIKSGTHVMHIKVLQKFVPLKTSNNNVRFPTLIRICICMFVSFCRWCVIFKLNRIVPNTYHSNVEFHLFLSLSLSLAPASFRIY